MSRESEVRDIATTLLGLTRGGGDRAALHERLFSQVYAELRGMAASLLRSEQPDHTLQPTELIHEAYLKLLASHPVTWEGRAHFFGAAARAMREILVEAARRRGARKRGGDWRRVTLHPELADASTPSVNVLALDDCLSRLADLDSRMAQVVELRIFAGMSIPEVACALAVSERTVSGDWSFAKKWLRRELEPRE